MCSEHFVDRKPSAAHPDPELHLGYDLPDTKLKRKAPKARSQPPQQAEMDAIHNDDIYQVTEGMRANIEDHEPKDMTIVLLTLLIQILLTSICKLQREKSKLVKENLSMDVKLKSLERQSKKSQCEQILKTDKDCRFYTGIGVKAVFNKLHEFISPFVRRRWRGYFKLSTKVKRVSLKKSFGPGRKLPSIDEFLLVLMRLRLGLTNKDLADRFNISESLASSIFQTWLTPMSKIIGAMVYWPPKEEIIASKPARYRHLPDLVSIIDCSEIFIETPKNMDLQFMTWSDYKHHNTLKFLISVTPNSAISYISDLYCGRISDKAITKESGYLDLLQPYDHIMADKGFPIQAECEARHVTLHVPPGRRGKAQMLPAHLIKAKRIANLRILVEQIIRRMKCFRFIKYEMPISVVYLADKILKVVGGLCNLQKPMYNC